ncbi:uncharacterized protein LOC132315938 [Cornus florida]|uniref:uncharacterized protein LOC132315938 n=1 Tax=Cornus florida TaxID=4283 RepID=UPI0028A2C8F2|nr:uncharacterized protein LOC132315938 [Cornus florida]
MDQKHLTKKMMYQKKTNVTDLNYDVLKLIISSVANSPNGAVNFARTISVCKAFRELSEDKDILKSVDFDDVRVSRRDRSFWYINGLLSKCANAGNWTAYDLVLEDLNERIESMRVKMRAMEAAKENFLEKMVAVSVVHTRARARAAESAQKEILEMFRDVEIDRICKEIKESMERIKHVVIPHKWQAWWKRELNQWLSSSR